MADVVTLSREDIEVITKALRQIDKAAPTEAVSALTRQIREVLADGVGGLTRDERRYVSIRTREALAERKARGLPSGGSPRRMPDQAVNRVHQLRKDGLTVRAIAEKLNAEGVPTATGKGVWKPGSVNHVLKEYPQ